MPFTYEEKYSIILDVVRKYKNKWRLDIIHWYDWDDVQSELLNHVYLKWEKWDQSRPLEPWVSIVCLNQIRNKLRNHYTNYARPCIKCPHNIDDHACAITPNNEQCSQCPIFAAWVKNKKSGFDIKMPLELENHAGEVNNRISDELDYSVVLEKLSGELKKHLPEKTVKAFYMLNFDGANEKDVGAYLGFKAKPFNSVSKQMKEFKAQLMADVKTIVKESDISEMLN